MSRDVDFEQEIHRRLLAGDPTASEELARKYLPIVERHVRVRAHEYGVRDKDVIYDSTVDAVFDYVLHPEKFDPLKSGLIGYLKRAAERDLMNELQKDRRRRRGEDLYENVELSILERNKASDVAHIRRDMESETITRIESERRLAKASTKFNSRDYALLQLMEEGERSTSRFAAVLGIETLPIPEQRRIVKQHKDRLKVQQKRERSGRRVRP